MLGPVTPKKEELVASGLGIQHQGEVHQLVDPYKSNGLASVDSVAFQ